MITNKLVILICSFVPLTFLILEIWNIICDKMKKKHLRETKLDRPPAMSIEDIKKRVNMNDSVDKDIVEAIVIDHHMPSSDKWIEACRAIALKDAVDVKPSEIYVGCSDGCFKVFKQESSGLSSDLTFIKEYRYVDYASELPKKVTYDFNNPFALAEIIVKCNANEDVKASLLNCECRNVENIGNNKASDYVKIYVKTYLQNSKNPSTLPFKISEVDFSNDNKLHLGDKLLRAEEEMINAGII